MVEAGLLSAAGVLGHLTFCSGEAKVLVGPAGLVVIRWAKVRGAGCGGARSADSEKLKMMVMRDGCEERVGLGWG